MSERYNWENGLLLNPPVFPKTAAEYQPLLDSGDFSTLEDVLMEHLDAAPQDIAFYLPAYRAFIRKQDQNRATAFLGLHVESLKACRDSSSETALLQAILGFWQDCKVAHDLLRGHLETMYSDSPNFEKFARHLRIFDNAVGIKELRELELRLRYDEGRTVYIPSKGVGRITEANPKLGVVRMVLKDGEKMSLRIDEAERLAQSLSNSHFLTRTITDTDLLKQTAVDDPGELLRLLFESVRREVTLGELREMISGIVPDTEWSRWWTRARKDSRLIVGSGKKPTLNWNDSVAEGSAELLTIFQKAPIRDKIEMLKKHASRSEDMASEMARVLAGEASSALQSEPSLALEIILTVADLPECNGAEMPFPAEKLLSRDDAGSIIAGIGNRLIRRKAVKSLTTDRDDWPRIFVELLRTESDASLFKLMYESLHDTGRGNIIIPEIERTFASQSDNPHFFVWLCREIPNRHELRKYAEWNFLRSLLDLLDNSAYKRHHPALRALFDPGEAVDRAVETLDAATGRSLLKILSRVRGLEDYRKESVRQKLLTLFPKLFEDQEEPLFATRESLDRKKKEYEKLVKEDIPRNAREIQRTREYGDLRENFEYHEARRQAELLSSRAKTMHDELIAARAIEPTSVDTSKISIGTRIRLQPETDTDNAVMLTILGPWDSDPANNVLSYTSAAAEALLNAPKKSNVTFNGVSYVVDTIDVWTS